MPFLKWGSVNAVSSLWSSTEITELSIIHATGVYIK